MPPKRKRRESFADLVTDVEPLKPSAKKVTPEPPKGMRPQIIVDSTTGPALHVERINGVVIAHAPDVPESVAHQLHAGPLPPLRHLDLHRMSVSKARSSLRTSVQQARRDGIRSLVVIFGRGTHSGSTGPVLPDVVIETLSTTLAGHVLAFRSAPPQFGGEGALIVRLRKVPGTGRFR